MTENSEDKNMGKINQSIAELVGRTPLLKLNGYEKKFGVKSNIIGKLEYFNPNQSVKDRIALAMIEDAEAKGILKPGDTVVETTSGNTGIGLAAIAASKGYSFRVYIQDQVSEERFKVIQAFGGKTIKLTEEPAIAKTLAETNGDFVAAIKSLKEEVLSKEKNTVFVDQCSNPANPAVHKRTTGPEIWEQTDGKVDIFVAGVGTGGTLTGVGEYLKEKNPNVKIVAVEPASSPVLSKGTPGPHKIQGIGAGFVPDVLNTKIYDEIITVENDDAFTEGREFAHSEGILVGISSGAALKAAKILAEKPENKGKNIVVLLPDSGDRYLSTALFNEN